MLLLLATGGGKLLQASSSLAIRDSLTLTNRTWKTIGALELLAVVGLIVGIWCRSLASSHPSASRC
ncbi:DoxX family protein [Lacisediminihabitans sp. G11-30]|uniref:DoxX family protein n=1 Tax=Lacisediminihabitans changchengi TaxID=2787634 RepID=A0A934SRL7_9MICO|nr:DoxX family protein [Lacisediminihabitans changchengi]